MPDVAIPENMLQLLDIADDVIGPSEDFQPLLDTFSAARDRVLKCGDESAWRLLVHDVPPAHLPDDQQQQLVTDARYLHHMVKAVNVRAWGQTLGAALHISAPHQVSQRLNEAWQAIIGNAADYGAHFDGKPPMRRWLKESFAAITCVERAAVRKAMDAAPTLACSQ